MTGFNRRIAMFGIALCLGGSAVAATAESITGAGSTFVYPVLSKWAADYKGLTGDQINYQSIGSGGGIAQIKAGTVDFGATDKPLSPSELDASGLAQFPVAIGGVVPVVNIAGIRPGQLKLDGATLADIYLGRVKTWNAPQIARLNPGLKLPGAPITAVHRSDGSGTTFNFTHYLSQVNGVWKQGPSEGTSVNWTGGIGGKGNEGVAAYVNQIPNSIGYVEYAYVRQNHMNYALMRNSAGKFVTPSAKSFQAAAATANWAASKDFFLVMTNAPGAEAYPITASTFALMYKHPKNASSANAARKFFLWTMDKGQKQALALDYVPLPPALVAHIKRYMAVEFK